MVLDGTIDPAELALVADELPVAIWMGRVPSGEVTYTNREFRHVLGIEPPPGAARGTFVAPYGVHTIDGAPYPEERMPFERVIAARATVVVDDMVIHRRDGRKVHLRVFAKPLFDAEGTMTHVLEAFIDITREFESERARIEGERRLARAQRLESVGQLAAGIAHDFNNLLTVTKLVVSRLLSGERDEERREALAQVAAVTDSAVGLIRNLLEFAGRRRHVPVPVSLDAVVGSVVDIARRTFDRRLTVTAQLDSAGSAVLGDASQLEQVVMNLLLNARDAIEPSRSGSITVRTFVAAGQVVLEVADTGPGIDPSLRERVFEPYFTTKTWGSVKGTGLGLATVHGIVTSHGGSVEIVDDGRPGTTMRVTLPATEPVVRHVDEGPPSAPPISGHDRVVLVVDDEPLVLDSTATTLRSLGYRVLTASDGLAALDVVRQHAEPIHVALVDLVMPGLDGRQVASAITEQRPGIPVVLCTGCVVDDALREELEKAAQPWLAKPYDRAQLAACLATVRR